MAPQTKINTPFIPLLVRPYGQVFSSNQETDRILFIDDILINIFWKCVEARDKTALCAFGSVNKYHYQTLSTFANIKISFEEFFCRLSKHCDKINFLDPRVLQYTSALPILCSNFDAINSVEDNAGATALYYEGHTLQKLKALGQSIGLELDLFDELILNGDQTFPLEKPCLSIVTNGIFINSRNKTPHELIELVEKSYECRLLTARKAVYTILRVFEASIHQKRLFAHTSVCQLSHTYTSTAYSSPPLDDFLAVGVFGKYGGSIDFFVGSGNEEYIGAGGQWEFPVYKL